MIIAAAKIIMTKRLIKNIVAIRRIVEINCPPPVAIDEGVGLVMIGVGVGLVGAPKKSIVSTRPCNTTGSDGFWTLRLTSLVTKRVEKAFLVLNSAFPRPNSPIFSGLLPLTGIDQRT